MAASVATNNGLIDTDTAKRNVSQISSLLSDLNELLSSLPTFGDDKILADFQKSRTEKKSKILTLDLLQIASFEAQQQIYEALRRIQPQVIKGKWFDPYLFATFHPLKDLFETEFWRTYSDRFPISKGVIASALDFLRENNPTFYTRLIENGDSMLELLDFRYAVGAVVVVLSSLSSQLCQTVLEVERQKILEATRVAFTKFLELFALYVKIFVDDVTPIVVPALNSNDLVGRTEYWSYNLESPRVIEDPLERYEVRPDRDLEDKQGIEAAKSVYNVFGTIIKDDGKIGGSSIDIDTEQVRPSVLASASGSFPRNEEVFAGILRDQRRNKFLFLFKELIGVLISPQAYDVESDEATDAQKNVVKGSIVVVLWAFFAAAEQYFVKVERGLGSSLSSSTDEVLSQEDLWLYLFDTGAFIDELSFLFDRLTLTSQRATPTNLQFDTVYETIVEHFRLESVGDSLISREDTKVARVPVFVTLNPPSSRSSNQVQVTRPLYFSLLRAFRQQQPNVRGKEPISIPFFVAQLQCFNVLFPGSNTLSIETYSEQIVRVLEAVETEKSLDFNQKTPQSQKVLFQEIAGRKSGFAIVNFLIEYNKRPELGKKELSSFYSAIFRPRKQPAVVSKSELESKRRNIARDAVTLLRASTILPDVKDLTLRQLVLEQKAPGKRTPVRPVRPAPPVPLVVSTTTTTTSQVPGPALFPTLFDDCNSENLQRFTVSESQEDRDRTYTEEEIVASDGRILLENFATCGLKCYARTSLGVQCSRTNCYLSPLCKWHLASLCGLEIRWNFESKTFDLFALRNIPDGSFIAYLSGFVRPLSQLNARYPFPEGISSYPQVFVIDDEKYFDALRSSSQPGRYVGRTEEETIVNAVLRATVNPNFISVFATKDIEPSTRINIDISKSVEQATT